MGFEKGNEFWKFRTKHGRDRVIKDPVKLEEDANEYFQWCIDNPIMVTELFNTKTGVVEYEKPLRRPFQKDGLALSLGLSGWRLIDNLKKVSVDFLQVITRIESQIYTQKFEGATVGQFNATIVSRDLGLRDNQDITSAGEKITQIYKFGNREIEI